MTRLTHVFAFGLGYLVCQVLLLLSACAPAFQPKQAHFALTGCDDVAVSFETVALEWEIAPDPVLRRGPATAWDAVDVLNPSVVKVGGILYNLYSGFDGSQWATGLATSRDGVAWEKQGTSPVLLPAPGTWEGHYLAANGSVYHDGQQFLYWYQAGPRGFTQIGLAMSTDAQHWQKHALPVLAPGPAASWDETALGDPYVIRCAGTYYLFYLGQNRFGTQRLGVARSIDGIHWQKSHTNPILDTGPLESFDERGLGEPAVFHTGGRYFMLYTGRNRREQRQIGWAESTNGVDWKKTPGRPQLEGSQPWNNEVVCDPTLWLQDDRLLVWFGGGDKPSPDENLNGEIGLAVLKRKEAEDNDGNLPVTGSER